MSDSDKPKTPEEMAAEYCKQFGEWDLTLGGRALMHRIFLAGYARGKADAEGRIWKEILVLWDDKISCPASSWADAYQQALLDIQPKLKQIIFGGGDE